MRQLASGGLEFGKSGGPEIDIILNTPRPNYTPRDVIQELAAELSTNLLGWFWAKDTPLNLTGVFPRSWIGIVGRAKNMAFRFMFPPSMTIADALREIEASDDLPPAILCCAFLLAERGLKRGIDAKCMGIAVTLASRSLVVVDAYQEAGAYLKPRSRKEITALASQLFQPGSNTLSGFSGFGLARLMMEAGALAWQREYQHCDIVDRSVLVTRAALSRAAQATINGDETAARQHAKTFMLEIADMLRETGAGSMIHDFAAADAMLQSDPVLEIAGVKLKILPYSSPTAYLEMREMVKHKIDPGTLHRLLPDGVLAGGELPESAPDLALLDGIARGLLRDADERAAFTPPTGAFRLDWPPEIPLDAIDHLVIVPSPERLWVSVYEQDSGEHPTAILCWYPGREMSNCLTVPPGTGAWLNVVLCALWRDMRVAGDAVLPVVNPSNGQAPKSGHRRAGKGSATRPNAVRVLPASARRLEYRRWGSDVERAEIQRRAHGVRGHLRQLPGNWQRSDEALAMAGEFGVILPEGFTFVRPHVRGQGGEQAEPGVVSVKARGLATILSLLGKVV